MINHSDTKNTVYNINDDLYWNSESLYSEMDRVYDICIGCRLCFNLCPSFPSLFSSIDKAGDKKRDQAVLEGKAKEIVHEREYLNLPEGEHATEASDEVVYRGEVNDLSDQERWEVVDLCYQCKLCDPICPYTPGKDHEFKLDFPKLMTRAQAIRSKERGISISDKFLASTDFTGVLGSLFGPIINLSNKIPVLRFLMEKVIGIHRKRILPSFQSSTFSDWIKNRKYEIEEPQDKVAIFGTCFTNSHDLELGKAAIAVLEHNNIEYIFPDQQCCGAPYLSPGDFDGFKNQAKLNVNSFSDYIDKGYKIIVTGPPTCSLTLKKEYKDYLDINDKVEKISSNTYDISEYLVMLNKKGKLKNDFKKKIGKTSYHVSCHLKAQQIGFKGRDILKLISDEKVSLINRCSGMDGGWGMKTENFDESIKVADKCLNDISQVNSETVCSDCSLASHQLNQASKNTVVPSHPIVELFKAYGLKI